MDEIGDHGGNRTVGGGRHAASPRIAPQGDGLDDLAADALLLDDGGIVIVGKTILAFEPEIIRHIPATTSGRYL